MDPQKLVEIALSYVGVSGDCPAFQELLGPPGHWPLSKPFGKGGISTCAVVARGFLRILGMPLGPYVTGLGLNDAIAIAKAAGAWHTSGRPPVGSVVELQGPTSIHCLTVVDWEGDWLISVDGGMVAADGLQAIKKCRRLWQGGALGGRRMIGWIDVASF